MEDVGQEHRHVPANRPAVARENNTSASRAVRLADDLASVCLGLWIWTEGGQLTLQVLRSEPSKYDSLKA